MDRAPVLDLDFRVAQIETRPQRVAEKMAIARSHAMVGELQSLIETIREVRDDRSSSGAIFRRERVQPAFAEHRGRATEQGGREFPIPLPNIDP
jgi:hypothetical protein